MVKVAVMIEARKRKSQTFSVRMQPGNSELSWVVTSWLWSSFGGVA